MNKEKLKTVSSFVEPLVAPEQYKLWVKDMIEANEYGLALEKIVNILQNAKKPIPKSLYLEISEIGEMMYHPDGLDGAYQDRFWESLENLVVPD